MMALMDMVQLYSHVGTLLKPEKVIVPTTSLSLWMDTIDQEAKFPDNKLAALLSELPEFKTILRDALSCLHVKKFRLLTPQAAL